MYPGVLPGHSSTSRAREADQSRGQRSLSHLGSARRARQQRTGGHGLANPGCGAAVVTERDPPRPGVGPGCRIWRKCWAALIGVAVAQIVRLRAASGCVPKGQRPGRLCAFLDGQALARPPVGVEDLGQSRRCRASSSSSCRWASSLSRSSACDCDPGKDCSCSANASSPGVPPCGSWIRWMHPSPSPRRR